ncbi:DUF87 domain-containing protein [Pusillimonas caeni]|uniref:type IV secretion system DNA-binding domain-containing protein n=1 Tax=Pusillimonas caeni TaxID=1348472 RepID=UPI000E59D87D|nr:type IV secretion system DNA-binding domain-containing protein [Pusillimonas caeni]TFL14063.1 DUF87 domain-containing protein [Pusillimonas caeni]
MAPHIRRRITKLALLVFPACFWLITALVLSGIAPRSATWLHVAHWMRATPFHLELTLAPVAGLFIALALGISLKKFSRTKGFDGAGYKKYIRGTQVVPFKTLVRRCREKGMQQVDVAGVPMPSALENLHLLLNGATGSGKSVLLRALLFSVLKRRDRAVVVDPNGDLFSKFGRRQDILLNPYDARTQEWMFFNEVRADYDWKRLSFSVVPLGPDANAEEWNSFGRLLLRAVSRKLHMANIWDIKQVIYWCCEAPFKDLQIFLKDTEAEALFSGASESTRAFDSARFVLSNKLSEHRSMPAGQFSIRDWMENGKGSLYITWREDMKTAMKPLLSAWVDVFCSAVLSMPENPRARWWLFIDELASLEKLASLEDVLTKGRKHGVRVVAGLQSVSQLASIYGKEMAQTLRASFRNLVVLGGSKTDPETAKEMSTALGEHEVLRPKYVDSRNPGRDTGTTEQMETIKEAVVTPSQIQALPELTGYVAFAEDRPITKFKLIPVSFASKNAAFVERAGLNFSAASTSSWPGGQTQAPPCDISPEGPTSGEPTTLRSMNDLPSDPTQG